MNKMMISAATESWLFEAVCVQTQADRIPIAPAHADPAHIAPAPYSREASLNWQALARYSGARFICDISKSQARPGERKKGKKKFSAWPVAILGTLCCGVAQAAPLHVGLADSDPALTCGAKNTPSVAWSGELPQGTKSLAALLWDQAPGKLTGRWLVYDLPVNTAKLVPASSQSSQMAGGKVATNDVGKLGYTAVCTKGQHDLYLDFYALDVASLNQPAGTPLRTVHAAIHKHKLLEAKAHLVWRVR